MSVPDPLVTGITVAGALQIANQAQEFIAAAAGHPGESVGTLLGNITHRRRMNAESVVTKSHFILLNIGVNPGEVKLGVLHPLLEAASLEEDDYLQQQWANLLANAADPRRNVTVSPAYSTTLRELTHNDALFLNAIYESWEKSKHRLEGALFADLELKRIFQDAGLARVGWPDNPFEGCT